MLLEIDDWRSVGDLQYRFNKCFTNLHLQLFAPDGSAADGPLSAAYSLEQIRRVHRPGVLTIKSWFTCREVARLLLEHYGLQARVAKLEEGREIWKPRFAHYTLHELNSLAKARPEPVLACNIDEEPEVWQ